jgi:hypothetical protein
MATYAHSSYPTMSNVAQLNLLDVRPKLHIYMDFEIILQFEYSELTMERSHFIGTKQTVVSSFIVVHDVTYYITSKESGDRKLPLLKSRHVPVSGTTLNHEKKGR